MGSCTQGPTPFGSTSDPPCCALHEGNVLGLMGHLLQCTSLRGVQPQGSAHPWQALPCPAHQTPASHPQGRASMRAMSAALCQVQACLSQPSCACSRARVPCQALAAGAVASSELLHGPGPSWHHKQVTQPAAAPLAPGLAPQPQISLSGVHNGASTHRVGACCSTETCPAQGWGTCYPKDRHQRKRPA